MTLTQLKQMKEQFERDGQQIMGLHLTAAQAKSLRWELHQYYGADPGEHLMPLYGMEILSIDAETLRFVV